MDFFEKKRNIFLRAEEEKIKWEGRVDLYLGGREGVNGLFRKCWGKHLKQAV